LQENKTKEMSEFDTVTNDINMGQAAKKKILSSAATANTKAQQ
jgi:hypothetical protein